MVESPRSLAFSKGLWEGKQRVFFMDGVLGLWAVYPGVSINLVLGFVAYSF